MLVLGKRGETVQVVGYLLLVWNGKWAVRLLKRDVATVVWRGERVQVVWWLLLTWKGKWAVRLLGRDVATGVWRGRNSTGSGVFIVNVEWKVGSEVTGA